MDDVQHLQRSRASHPPRSGNAGEKVALPDEVSKISVIVEHLREMSILF